MASENSTTLASDMAVTASSATATIRMPAGGSRLLLLNLDVFSVLLALLHPLDALHIAMTSHRAYSLAIGRFHSEVHIGYDEYSSLSGPEQIIKFCKYMLAESARATQLKSLSIGPGGFIRLVEERQRDTWQFDPSCATELAQLLCRTRSLRQLLIDDYESVVKLHPTLGDAIEELPNLVDLAFKHVGHASLKTVSCLIGRIRKLEFGLWKGGPLTSTDAEPFVNLKDSLETITLRSCACLVENVGIDYVWPRVHSLILGGRVPPLSTLVHAFPDARSMEFIEGCSVARDEAPTSYWDTLDFVETSLPLPFLACPVRRVKLSYILGNGNVRATPETFDRTITFLERANPVVFSCGMVLGLDVARIQKLTATMRRVKFLELALHQKEFSSDKEGFDFQQWIVSVSICHQQIRANNLLFLHLYTG